MDNASQSTEQLIAQARAGDETAFAELLRRFGSELQVPSLKHCTDGDPTWDKTLSQTWQQYSNFKGTTGTELNDWLRKTVSNPLPTTSTDGNLETIAPRPNRETIVSAPSSELDAHESDSPDAPDPLATIPPGRGATQRNDPLATIPPGGDTTHGNDPLATMAERPSVRPPSQPVVKTFGHFEILETIAKGGMGVVYKAKDRKLDRIVALKMILAGQFANSDDIDRFYDEAKAAAHLNHVNIVGIYEVGEYEEQHYISMQIVEGQSLADLVREKPLHPRAAAKYMQAIAEAMQYAHDERILHRDLKPSNILVDGNDVPLVTDFGLAKLNPHDRDEAAQTSVSQRSMDGVPMGTPSYMPPEQAIGKLDDISVRSDVYSLGATLYDLLTGKPPFGAANVMETLRQVKEVEPVAPRLLNPNVPKDLETICLKCLQKSPTRRYASSQELADELRRYLAGKPIHARPVGFAERTIRWCYRNPWPTTAICASLCGLIVATVLWQFAVSARDQAKASRSQLFVAINELFTTWGNVKLLNEPALADVRKELLTAATKLYTAIGEDLGDDLELKQELGVSYYRLGLMMFHMEGYRDADTAVESALEIQLVNQDAKADQERLGESLTLSGSIKVKLSQLESDPDQRLVLLDEAEGLYLKAIKVRQKLRDLNPDEIEYKRQVWSVEMNLGNVSQWKGDAYDQRSFINEADLDASAADFQQSVEHYRKAKNKFAFVQTERERLIGVNPDALSVRHDLAQGSYNLANISRLLAEYASAETVAENAVREFISLLDIESNDLQNQFDLARCEQLAGEIAAEWIWAVEDAKRIQALYEEAVQHYNNAIAVYDALNRSSPSIVTRYKIALGELHMRIAGLHFDMEMYEAARTSYETAEDMLKPLVEAHPDLRQTQMALEEAQRGLKDAMEKIARGAPESTAPNPDATQSADPAVP